MNSEAAAGVRGLPQEFAAAVRRRSKSGKDAQASWRAENAKDSYDPWVQMAAAIIRRPGGRAALDAYVSRGDVAPLYFLLGREKLEHLADIAKSAGDLPATARPDETVLAQAMGLQQWLLRGLAAVVEGSPWSKEETGRRLDLAKRLLAAAHGRLDASPSFAREGALEAMAKLDLEDRLLADEKPEILIKAIDEADRSRGLRRYLPDVLTHSWKASFYSTAALGAVASVLSSVSDPIATFLTAHSPMPAVSAAIGIPAFVLLYLALGGGLASLWTLRRNTAAILPNLLRRARRRL